MPTSHPADAAICVRPLEETAGISATVRLHIVWLPAAGDRDVGTPAEETGQTSATVSHRLRKLKRAGIVGARRQLYILSDVRVFEIAPARCLQPGRAVTRSADTG